MMNSTVVNNDKHSLSAMFIKSIHESFDEFYNMVCDYAFLRGFDLEVSKMSAFPFLVVAFLNSFSSFSISDRPNGSKRETQPTIAAAEVKTIRQCFTDRKLSVTLTGIIPINTAENVETRLRSLNLDELFEHYKPFKDKQYGLSHFATRYDTSKFFQKYRNKKLDKGKNVRVMVKCCYYDCFFGIKLSVEANIDNLYSNIHGYKVAIHLLKAEIRSKEGKIKQRKINL
ncbi:hypothetical protein BY458DRAFT_548395 [Sporodiniella umbellata]|nr:hypothetical protein BY458DRAFT_548395 [Sporodiniella umbellata]